MTKVLKYCDATATDISAQPSNNFPKFEPNFIDDIITMMVRFKYKQLIFFTSA